MTHLSFRVVYLVVWAGTEALAQMDQTVQKVEPVVMEEEVGRVVIMLKIAAAMGAMAVTV
ncbi:TPA: hypothetical protein N7N97_005162, partial [Escherichia coli]|nr:hypothetical protein [Escherichia coli]